MPSAAVHRNACSIPLPGTVSLPPTTCPALFTAFAGAVSSAERPDVADALVGVPDESMHGRVREVARAGSPGAGPPFHDGGAARAVAGNPAAVREFPSVCEPPPHLAGPLAALALASALLCRGAWVTNRFASDRTRASGCSGARAPLPTPSG